MVTALLLVSGCVHVHEKPAPRPPDGLESAIRGLRLGTTFASVRDVLATHGPGGALEVSLDGGGGAPLEQTLRYHAAGRIFVLLFDADGHLTGVGPHEEARAAAPRPGAQAAAVEHATRTFAREDLRDVLTELAREAGINLLIPADVRGVVNATFAGVATEDSFRSFVEECGYRLERADIETAEVFRIAPAVTPEAIEHTAAPE
jgi:hypothetical protein